MLFHSDFNGLLKAEIERATLRTNFINSSYCKTFDNQDSENKQQNSSLQNIINYKTNSDATNSVRPLFPVRIESFVQIKASVVK